MHATRPATAIATLVLGALAAPGLRGGPDGAAPAEVAVVRTPGGGIQPQAAVDGAGVVHLVYYQGDPAGGDVFYARADDGIRFGAARRVNSQPGSAIAVGSIRGAQLALGKNGRVHVAWNGSARALPAAPGGARPMLYARLDDAGRAFEPQRNLIRSAVGLDGGGSVAADAAGRVRVVWHAPAPGQKGEANRRVWVAASTDEGRTFAAETAATDEPTGACGCCGLRAFADRKGTLYVLYRGARTPGQRDMYLLTGGGKGFAVARLHPWAVDACPMSSEAFAEGPNGVVAAWETRGQVYFARIDPATGKPSAPTAAPGPGRSRKHPALAVNTRGEMLLAWTEGTGWNQGGAAAWQVYGADGTPRGAPGRADGVPVWGLVAAFVRPDGRFAVMY